MPRFFIDLRDQSGVIHDEEGAFYSDIESALDEAKASARDLEMAAVVAIQRGGVARAVCVVGLVQLSRERRRDLGRLRLTPLRAF